MYNYGIMAYILNMHANSNAYSNRAGLAGLVMVCFWVVLAGEAEGRYTCWEQYTSTPPAHTLIDYPLECALQAFQLM